MRHVGGVFGTIAGTVISFLIGYLLVSLLNEMDVCDGGLALLS
jgi:high-affinity Fe2+/Pb2+ permease